MLLEKGELILQGVPICRGIAIGKPFFLKRDDLAIFEMRIPATHMQREIERYRQALLRSKQDLKRLQKQLEMESAADGIQILEAQLEMLHDPLMTIEIEKDIRRIKKNAEFVFQQALLKYQSRFQAVGDPFFIDRFKDLQDLSRRIISYLHETGNLGFNDMEKNSIVCAEDLSASDAAGANPHYVTAFITENGASTTHAAIIAKSKGIPYISNINIEVIKEYADVALIVDGRTGKLILNPSNETLEEYQRLQEQLNHQVKNLQAITKWPAQTYDGYSIQLSANLDMIHEIDLIRDLGGEGIGLFRSEYIFLPKKELPPEEEQFKIYSNIVKQMKGMPVVIRTFDLGGDKVTNHQLSMGDRNPFLGCRATRFLLRQQELFKEQLRAILRASVYGNVSILFPMIATISELRQAKRIIEEARQELNLFNPVPVGCMIEVPSAALIIDHFVKECDFFSIGTNDLVQYAMAIDRSDQESSEFYEPSDPSVIRLIKLITSEADKARIPVTVCGEIASDPRFTALLLGLGVQGLSVSPRYLPLIKNAIRNTSIVDAVHLAERALAQVSAQDVLKLLIDDYRKNVPQDLFYNSGHFTF